MTGDLNILSEKFQMKIVIENSIDKPQSFKIVRESTYIKYEISGLYETSLSSG